MVSKILTLNQISVKGLERLPRDTYEIASEFSHPDAILLRSHKLKGSDIADSVRCIARAGAGVNNVPVEECTKRGIPVFNSPGANANAVKELVAAALLLGSRGIKEGIEYVHTLGDMSDEAELNRTLEAQKKQFKGSELMGKTLGVVGLGAIGSLVAEMALTFGMEVVGYDPALSVEAAWRVPASVPSVTNSSTSPRGRRSSGHFRRTASSPPWTHGTARSSWTAGEPARAHRSSGAWRTCAAPWAASW